MQFLNKNKNPLHTDIIHLEKQIEEYHVEIAMQYTDAYIENIYSFANNINTIEGGMHLIGFKSALTRAVNEYLKKTNLLKNKEDTLKGEYVREGFTAIISIKLPEPQYEGQNKDETWKSAGMFNCRVLPYRILRRHIWKKILKMLKLLWKRGMNAKSAREVARKAREMTRRKKVFWTLLLSGKIGGLQRKRSGTF